MTLLSSACRNVSIGYLRIYWSKFQWLLILSFCLRLQKTVCSGGAAGCEVLSDWGGGSDRCESPPSHIQRIETSPVQMKTIPLFSLFSQSGVWCNKHNKGTTRPHSRFCEGERIQGIRHVIFHVQVFISSFQFWYPLPSALLVLTAGHCSFKYLRMWWHINFDLLSCEIILSQWF